MRRLLDHLWPRWICAIWDWRPIARPGDPYLDQVAGIVVRARTRRAAERRAERRYTDWMAGHTPHRVYARRAR